MAPFSQELEPPTNPERFICRHPIPPARYRVTNSLGALLRSRAAYEAGLRQWGDLTFWVEEETLAGWRAPRRSTPGGQPRYSELAIELVLTLWLVFHLALRQAEGFARSVLQLLVMALPVPDHTTLSRRGRTFAERQPRVQAGPGPVHRVLDSTGLSCSAKASGVRPCTAEPAGAGSCCTWEWTPAPARSPHTC